MNSKVAQIIGGVFILIGIIVCIVIGSSFEYGYYFNAFGEEKEMLFIELITTWVYGLGFLLGSSAVGVVLMSLSEIQKLLERLVDKRE